MEKELLKKYLISFIKEERGTVKDYLEEDIEDIKDKEKARIVLNYLNGLVKNLENGWYDPLLLKVFKEERGEKYE